MLSQSHGRMFWLGGLLSVVFLLYPYSITAADYIVGELPPNENYRFAVGALPASFSVADNPELNFQALERQVLHSGAQTHQVTIENPMGRGPIPHPPSPPPPPSEPPVSIPFASNGNAAYVFQADEISLLTSIMQILPSNDLTGITEIQSEPYRNDGVFETLGPGGVVSLYLPSTSTRLTDGFYPLLPYHLTDAIGEKAYNQALTSAQQQDWTILTSTAEPGLDPQQEFGEFYSLWTEDSYNFIQQALTNPPSSANPSLAQAFFIASLFLGSPSQSPSRKPSPLLGTYIANLEGYTGGGIRNNLISPSAISLSVENRLFAGPGFDHILIIGSYTFHVENNTLVSWSSGLGTFTPLNPPVALPAIWLSSMAAISSNAKGS